MADNPNPNLPTPPPQPHRGVAAVQATPEQQAEANRAASEVREKSQKAATEGVDKRTEEMKKANEEFYARGAASKPTPTQRENDLAKVGALNIDEKEDDGSGPDLQPVMRREAVSGDDPARYKTRNVSK